MAPERVTIGKVTYIHGAQPDGTRMHYDADGRVTAMFIPDPSIQAAMHAAFQPKPAAPSVGVYVEQHYGVSVGLAVPQTLQFTESDEFEVWSHQDRSRAYRRGFPWHLIAVSLAIISMVALVTGAAVAVTSILRFHDFLVTQVSTPE